MTERTTIEKLLILTLGSMFINNDTSKINVGMIVDRVLPLIDQHTKSEVRQVLDRLENELLDSSVKILREKNPIEWDSIRDLIIKNTIAERKLYE